MDNKYGLSRTIPEPIKRLIRQNAGFGCVICGNGIIEYEHVDPEFNEAKIHDPAYMTLLCPNCHAKVTSGMWSKQRVKDAMANPICLTQGYSNELFDIGKNYPKIHFAGSILENTPIPLMVNGVPIFEINPPAEANGVFRLSASFNDSKGNETLTIKENEWFASSENWDVEVVGPQITIRENKGRIAFQLIAIAPDTLRVTRIEMNLKGIKISGNENEFSITNPATKFTSTFSNCFAKGSRIGFQIDI